MLEFLRASSVDHPHFGLLKRSRGKWRGSIRLDGLPTAMLSVPGGHSGPAPAGLSLAEELVTRWPDLRPEIAEALHDHYLPYRESFESGDMPGEEVSFPRLSEPDEVWQHVSDPAVAIRAIRGRYEVLIGLQTGWDEEHTVGATIRDWSLVELSGSIGAFEL